MSCVYIQFFDWANATTLNNYVYNTYYYLQYSSLLFVSPADPYLYTYITREIKLKHILVYIYNYTQYNHIIHIYITNIFIYSSCIQYTQVYTEYTHRAHLYTCILHIQYTVHIYSYSYILCLGVFRSVFHPQISILIAFSTD